MTARLRFLGSPWERAARAFVTPEGWNEKTPVVVRDGCFLLPALAPLWEAFGRAHRWRKFNALTGEPEALPLEVVRFAAGECSVYGLSRKSIVRLLIAMDDETLNIIREARRQ